MTQEIIFIPQKTSIKEGISAKGKPYVKYGIKDESGGWLGTFDKQIYEILSEAEKTKKHVRVLFDQEGEFRNIVEAMMESQQGTALELATRLEADVKKLHQNFQFLLAILKE